MKKRYGILKKKSSQLAEVIELKKKIQDILILNENNTEDSNIKK